jgi:hypothetical protein
MTYDSDGLTDHEPLVHAAKRDENRVPRHSPYRYRTFATARAPMSATMPQFVATTGQSLDNAP